MNNEYNEPFPPLDQSTTLVEQSPALANFLDDSFSETCCLAGCGLSPIPAYSARNELASGELVEILPKPPRGTDWLADLLPDPFSAVASRTRA